MDMEKHTTWTSDNGVWTITLFHVGSYHAQVRIRNNTTNKHYNGYENRHLENTFPIYIKQKMGEMIQVCRTKNLYFTYIDGILSDTWVVDTKPAKDVFFKPPMRMNFNLKVSIASLFMFGLMVNNIGTLGRLTDYNFLKIPESTGGTVRIPSFGMAIVNRDGIVQAHGIVSPSITSSNVFDIALANKCNVAGSSIENMIRQRIFFLRGQASEVCDDTQYASSPYLRWYFDGTIKSPVTENASKSLPEMFANKWVKAC